MEYAFIQPILEALHWKLIYQTTIRRRNPDYALFLQDEKVDQALQAGKYSDNFWKYPTLLADAKAWGMSLADLLISGMQENIHLSKSNGI